MKEKIPKKYLGIVMIILSSFCFAFMNAFVKLTGDLPTAEKAFFRNFVAAIFAGIILVREKHGILPRKKALPYLLLRAIFGTLGIYCNFYAIDNLKVLSDAAMLNKMSPFFIIIFSFFILKERLTFTQVMTVVIAFAGAMFVIKPTFANMEALPSLIGFAGGMFAGLAYTFVRKLGQVGESGAYVVFFFSTFSCLISLPMALANFKPMSVNQIIILLLAGLSATGGQFAITAAYGHAPAREISVYDYSQIIFAGALSFVMFGTLPDFLSVIGYVIIILMALLTFIYNNQMWFFKRKKADKSA